MQICGFFPYGCKALNVVNCTGLYSIDHSLINISWTDQLVGGAGTRENQIVDLVGSQPWPVQLLHRLLKNSLVFCLLLKNTVLPSTEE